MDFIDLKSRHNLIGEQINKRVQVVMEHGQFILGPEVRELEVKLAEFVGVKHCVTVSSGTDSLLISLMVLELDQVTRLSLFYTWISSAEVIALLSSTVFVDIRSDTWNMDEQLLEASISEKNESYHAGFHLWTMPGYGCRKYNCPKVQTTCNRRCGPKLWSHLQRKKSCNLSTVGSTSFFPSKPLGCYGDAGAFTNDDETAEKFRWIRVHGQERKHHHPILGINGRMDTLQAAILLAVFEVFPDEVSKRSEIGGRYSSGLSEVPGLGIPQVPVENTSVYAQYTILCEKRDVIQESLKNRNIPSVSYYTVPLHQQPVFERLDYREGDFPVSEKIANLCLSLPMSPYLSNDDQDLIIETICGA